MVFHWNLSDHRSAQVFSTLLGILKNAVSWIVSICPPISNTSSLPSKPLETVPTKISLNVTLMFHSFLSSLARSKYLSLTFRFLWFSLCSQLGRQSPLYGKFDFFLLIITKSGLLAKITWSVCISKSQISVSFSRVLLLLSSWVIHTNISWWAFTEVRLTASFYGFIGLFTVFWLNLATMYSILPHISSNSD